jgi:formylglycine-generating enzyme required for sulfatase activity
MSIVAVIAFCSLAHATTIETVQIGHVGNAADPTTGYGAVNYAYSIGKHEVTNAQYAAFLNAVAATDTQGLYNSNMAGPYGGITRSGSAGSYTYATVSGRENMAVVYTDFADACRFTNWLHNGQLTGAAGEASTETGSYTMATNGPVTRNAGATWVLPSENEWYKAAYYQPASAGGDSDDYWLFATGGNSITTSQANYWGNPYSYSGVCAVGNFASNYFGTFDMSGNAWEWTDTGSYTARVIRGGSWMYGASSLEATNRTAGNPANETPAWGFRVALVPGPAGAALMALAALGARRRKA